MNLRRLPLALLTLAFGFLTSLSAQAEIKTVDHVDVGRYLGRWYQMARNPLPFEGDCACSQQTLGASSVAGTVTVHNSCNDKVPAGPLREIRGTATVVDPATNAKLAVDFGFPRLGEYWIIGLGANYEYAIVTDSKANSLYILSKTPVLDPTLYTEALQKAASQVDTSRLLRTEHAGCTYPN